ncbi:hypothetical protein OXX80_006553 [Metschnikowia pulcherrima]
MSFEERTQHFREWLTEKDVNVSTKIKIDDLRDVGQGRSVIATEDISEDEELFSIPRSALLNVDSCSLIKDRPETGEILADMTQWEALILVFMYEWKIKANNSPWRAYFDVLPVNDKSYESNQLIFWSKAELELLNPSYIVQRVGHDSASAMYDRLVPFFGKFVGDVTKDEFHLIASVIMAYSFDVTNGDAISSDEEESDEEDSHHETKSSEKSDSDELEHEHEHEDDPEKAEEAELTSDNKIEESEKEELVKNSETLKSMVPLADTLNADTRKHNASLFITADSLVMRSIKPILKNEQIYNIYSEHPNSEILRRYGYVEQLGSAHDFAEISLETFKKYFAENSSLSKVTIDEILAILREIEDEEDEKFILDTYDCFASGEVIFELTFLTQLFVIIAAINHKKSFNSASSEVKARAIRRVYKKSYQLLEARKLTAQFIKDFPNILKIRLSEYPRKAMGGLQPAKDKPLTRSEMAMVVLASECHSLQNCMDTEKVFIKSEQSFNIIDDEKLLRNIMKKDTFEGTETQPAKKKRLS